MLNRKSDCTIETGVKRLSNGGPHLNADAKSALVRSGPLWSALVRSGPLTSILVHSGPFWSILVHSGPSWSILVHPGPSWSILVRSRALAFARVRSRALWSAARRLGEVPRFWRGKGGPEVIFHQKLNVFFLLSGLRIWKGWKGPRSPVLARVPVLQLCGWPRGT